MWVLCAPAEPCSGHTVVLTCDGEVYVWGLGDLAVPRDSRHGPERVDLGGRRAVQIVCGAAHTLLLTDQGEVLGWCVYERVYLQRAELIGG